MAKIDADDIALQKVAGMILREQGKSDTYATRWALLVGSYGDEIKQELRELVEDWAKRAKPKEPEMPDKIYEIIFQGLEKRLGESGWRLFGEMITQGHPTCDAGDRVYTSKLKSIDFERGIAVTQDSIYVWKA